MERLKSRKFWVAVVSAVIVTVGEQFGIELGSEQVLGLASIASLYIVGQAQVDKQAAKAAVPDLVSTANRTAQKVTKEDANTELFQGE